MTFCEEYIRRLIKKKNFLTIAEFMEAALYHPEFGYYMQRQPLGSDADFITAPEVSLLFGETLCFWAVEHYYRLHQPKKIVLVELGPGRGILMADFLQTAPLLPDFFDALEIHLVEKSPQMKRIQQYLVRHPHVFWHDSLENLFDSLPPVPVLIIANEFFDALPIRQFQKTSQSWAERGIIVAKNHILAFGLQEIQPFDFSFPVAKPGAIVEYCSEAEEIMQKIVHHMGSVSGAFIILDYGYSDGYGDSLQAVSRHQYVPVLEKTGTVDITAHVNFGALKKIAGQNSQLTTQSDFLMRHGILKLAQAHAHKASEEEKTKLALQLYKLTSSREMGALFKALEGWA